MTKVTIAGTKSRPPIIATGSLSIVEGNTDIQVVATQPHGGGKLTYGITGGADAALFDIVNTGLMYFLVAPVFASPTDANTDNVYEVEVTVTGRGGLTDTQLILITVLAGGGGGDTVGTPLGLLFLLTHTISAGSYTAPAVHFSGQTLACYPISCTDNGLLSLSMWLNFSSIGGGIQLFGSTTPPPEPYDYYAAVGTEGFTPPTGAPSVHFVDALFENIVDGYSSLSPSNGAWTNLLIAVDTNHAGGSRIIKIFLDDVDVTASIVDDGGAPIVTPFNGSRMFFSGTSTPFAGDVADVWIAPGQFIDFSIEANRRKFIDAGGKPVDLGSDGSTPTGTAPAILFSGDHTTFATNLGTGGSFSLTGGALSDASTSPSD